MQVNQICGDWPDKGIFALLCSGQAIIEKIPPQAAGSGQEWTLSPGHAIAPSSKTGYTARIKPASVLFTCHSRGTLAVLSVTIRGVTGYVVTQVNEATTIESQQSGQPHVTGFYPAIKLVGMPGLPAKLEAEGVFDQLSVSILKGPKHDKTRLLPTPPSRHEL